MKQVIKLIVRIYIISQILILLTCNFKIEDNYDYVEDKDSVGYICDKDKVNKQIGAIKRLSSAIIDKSPYFFNRQIPFFIDDSLHQSVKCVLKELCPETFKSQYFNDFCKIFVLNEFYLDLLCCRQAYDLKHKLKGNFSPIRNGLEEIYRIDMENYEIFTSGLAFEYIAEDDNNRKQIDTMINRIYMVDSIITFKRQQDGYRGDYLDR